MVDPLDYILLISTIHNKYFVDGWGEHLSSNPLLRLNFAKINGIHIKLIKKQSDNDNGFYLAGTYGSPYDDPSFPEESREAELLMVSPQPDFDEKSQFCILIPASGDEGFGMRLPIAKRLLPYGITSIVMEGPYYGTRRPAGQRGACIRTVNDMWHLGAATVIEALALVLWLMRQGFRKVNIAGISRGGQLAVIAASLSPSPVAVTSLAGSYSAAPIFTEGLIRHRVAWSSLRHSSDRREELRRALHFSDVRNYPPPVKQKSIHLIGGRCDGYVKPEWVRLLHDHMPQAQLSWYRGGHVASYLFKRDIFCNAIRETLSILE